MKKTKSVPQLNSEKLKAITNMIHVYFSGFRSSLFRIV